MAKHKHIPFVVLGAHDKPNKGMIAYKVKDGNSYWLSIVQLKNDGKYDLVIHMIKTILRACTSRYYSVMCVALTQ